MKTVIIFDQCCQESLMFFVVEGDKRHLNGIYINGSDDEEKVDELNLLFYGTDGVVKLPAQLEFPIIEVVNGAKVIVCGFFP